MAKIPHIDPMDLIGAVRKPNKKELARIEDAIHKMVHRRRKENEIDRLTGGQEKPKITYDEARATIMEKWHNGEDF